MDINTANVFLPLLQPARFKGAWGGRGSGKSHFFGELLVEEMILGHIRAVCARETQNSIADSSKQLIDDKIYALGLVQTHTTQSIKSLEGFNRLWIDEAQSVSQKSLDLAIPTFRTAGSQIWCSWNPEKETDPVDKFFRENENDPNVICVRANYLDNPYFPDELRADMERDKRRDPDKYAHVWLGEYQRNSEARVFKNWTVAEFERPVGTVFRLGLDFGFAVDPTALVRCSLDGNALYIDYEAVMVGCEIVNTPDLLRRVPESDKWFITADSARPETISHLQNHGDPKITYAKKGAGSVDDGVEFLKSFDIIVHPRCTETIRELTLYSYKTDKLTGAILPIFEDKNNHVIDALRYACEGIRHVRKKKERKAGGYVGSGSWM